MVGAIGLTGCSTTNNETTTNNNTATNDEAYVRAVVEAEFDELKNLEGSVFEDSIADLESDETMSETLETFEMLSLDIGDFLSAVFADFEYSIDSITVDGDTANVVMMATARHGDDITAAFTEISNDEILEAAATGGYSRVGEMIIEVMNSVEPRQTEPFTLELTKNDQVWELTDDSAANFYEPLG